MIASIGFDDYCISCIIGVYPEERIREQNIFVDLRVGHEITACIQEDDVSKTLCYVELATLCEQLAKRRKFKLLETFAAETIDQILKTYGQRYVWIRLRKPNALPSASATVVEVTWDGR